MKFTLPAGCGPRDVNSFLRMRLQHLPLIGQAGRDSAGWHHRSQGCLQYHEPDKAS
jgi:hypothetical protein